MDPLYEQRLKSIRAGLDATTQQRRRTLQTRNEVVKRLRTAADEARALLAEYKDELLGTPLTSVDFKDDANGATLKIRVLDREVTFSVDALGVLSVTVFDHARGREAGQTIKPLNHQGTTGTDVSNVQRIFVVDTSDGPRCSLIAVTGQDVTLTVSLADMLTSMVAERADRAHVVARDADRRAYGQTTD